MPYTDEHREKSREKILISAGRLFSRRGYDAISIDDLMRDAGLTRGASYHHFSSKAHVYSESIAYMAAQSPIANGGACEELASVWLERILGKYLSREHIETAELPCPLAFLVTDVGNREPGVRRTYTAVCRALVARIQEQLQKTENYSNESTALALSALMIGAVAIGRALDTPAVTEALLRRCLQQAQALISDDTGAKQSRIDG